jgi:phosphoserine phosphatase RsbU/P
MIALSADTHSWIDGVCRRLSEATGWPVRFVPRATQETFAADAGVDEADAGCWSMDLREGERIAGRLEVGLPADARRDRAYLAVCELAGLTGELIAGLLAARGALEQRTNDVSTLVDIGRSLANDAEPQGILNRLLQAAVDLTGFRAAAFFLLAPAVNSLNLRGVAGMEAGCVPHPRRELEAGLPDLTALAEGRVLVRPRAGRAGEKWLPDKAGTGLAVAVQSDGGPLGTLWVYDRRRRMPGEREMTVIESIAAQLANVLERVVLLRESAVQHRMQRDLTSASECQPAYGRGLSGFGERSCPAAGFDVAALCTSRYELGGDMCEVIRLDEHRTLVAVGDASGDSVPAAMVMSAVRGSLRTLADAALGDVTDTAALVQRINRTLYQITPPHQFMSLVCGLLDTRDNTFTYTNAGHPTPVWISGGEPLSLKSHGLLLGVDDETTYHQSTIRLEPGDLLVLYSDGISEARDACRQLFGSAGVIAALKECQDRPAADVLETVWSRVDAHAEETGDADDRTLLVIRVGE